MPGERHGVAAYFGIDRVEYAKYTISHGLSPGRALIRAQPSPLFQPGAISDLTITDGYGTILVPKCKIVQVQEVIGASGRFLEVLLEDRRWQWLTLGSISGEYNTLDQHAKLIPWFVRSPKQLANLCLAQMGETCTFMDLPDGLEGPMEAPNFLPPGEQLPQTLTNPPVVWYGERPMQALARMCEYYGRRVVYRLDTDSVAIVRPGFGGPLPEGSKSTISPSVTFPAKPDVVAVLGAPTRYQSRFVLQAVGEEWDGTYKPINALSYAPIIGEARQVVTVTVVDPWNIAGTGYQVLVNDEDYLYVNPGGAIAATVAAQLETKISKSKKVVVTRDGAVLTITGKDIGVSFTLHAQTYGWPAVADQIPRPAMDVVYKTPASSGKPSWRYCTPPLFPNVRATLRLTYPQAKELAQKSVWRYYQVVNVDPSFRPAGGAVAIKPQVLTVPGFGEIKRRQQLYLLPTKVDQVTPEAPDLTFKARDGQTLINNYYNGLSRDRPAEVFGSVSIFLHDATYVGGRSLTTGATDKVHVSFSIDPVHQLVVFAHPVYTFDSDVKNDWFVPLGVLGGVIPQKGTLSGIAEPYLLLETSCQVRDPDSNQFAAYASAGFTPGQTLGTNLMVQVRDDVQLNVTCDYNDKGQFSNLRLLEADAINRANYYVEGMKLQFLTSAAQTNTYNGIVPCFLDGAVTQASWETQGPEGCSTMASMNTEHDFAIPDYPTRRRQELLNPVDASKNLDDAGKSAAESAQKRRDVIQRATGKRYDG